MATAVLSCQVCNFPGSDVRVIGCGCSMHARCVPVTAIATFKSNEKGFEPVEPDARLCPCCRASPVSAIHLLPLALDDLDKAVEIRKAAGRVREGDAGDPDDFLEVEAEASYVQLSRNVGSISASLSENDYQRTGRWTHEETAYVDFLVLAFDHGKLPISEGVRLTDFLGDMLMSKASRLTKKMKNAKLSSRSFELSPKLGSPETSPLDVEMLSSLQDKFFQSITNEAARLELRFYVTKAWRSHFSNFCLQLGSDLLQADEWITSLEIMERRAAKAEETLRLSRRRRMGLALKTDARSREHGVFLAGMPARSADPKSVHGVESNIPTSIHISAEVERSVTSDESVESELISRILDASATIPGTYPIEEFSNVFDDLLEEPQSSSMAQFLSNNCGSFVEEIVTFMETNDLPFQHVDVWVPSYVPTPKGEEIRLCHGGHGTRRDIDPALFFRLCEWGEYSKKFSFAVGCGLPGRVHYTDFPKWEVLPDNANPKIYERAGGAKIYGLKTGFGVPIVSKVIGRIVVVMYSISAIPEDQNIINYCVSSFSKYCPQPMWKLVVEMGNSGENDSANFPTKVDALGPYHDDQKVPALPRAPPPAPWGLTTHAIAQSPASIPPELEKQEDEQRIATMLGEHMPIADLVSDNDHAPALSQLVPHFMTLRLLLLHPPSCRTKEDSVKIDVIVNSFRGYCRDQRRSDKEIVHLLVQDWFYLNKMEEDNKKPAAKVTSKAATIPAVHQSHVMKFPNVNTYTQSGAPARRPQALPFVAPPPERRVSSDDLGEPNNKRRRLSTSTNGTAVTSNVRTGATIVDDA